MSVYDDIMRRIMDEITRHQVVNFRAAHEIELDDADYDAVVAAATWHDPDTDDPAEAKHYDLTRAPREGGTVFGIPVRANSELARGQIKVS